MPEGPALVHCAKSAAQVAAARSTSLSFDKDLRIIDDKTLP